MFQPGAVVVVHLGQPAEKVWGVLQDVGALGLVLRALPLSSFDDWLAEVASDDPPSIGLSTVFVPMSRVERVYLDEQSGEALSFSQRFERRTGIAVREYLSG